MMLQNLPPTDNLYKFCAIVGVAVVLICLYAEYHAAASLYAGYERALLENQRLRVEREALDLRLTELGGLIRLSRAKPRARPPAEKGEGPLAIGSSDFEKQWVDFQNDWRAYRRSGVEADAIFAQTQRRERIFRALLWAANIVVGIGLVIAVYGFRNWYRRVQVYQDLMLKKSIERDTI